MGFKVGDKVFNKVSGKIGEVSEEWAYDNNHFGVDSVVYRKDDFDLVAENKMKYKVGDKVLIVDNKSSHGFNLGDVVVVDRVNDNDKDYLAYRFQAPDESWFVTEDDVTFFMDLKLQTPMEIVDSYYESKAVPDITKDDPVESPSHYSSDKIECVDYLKDNMPFEAYLGGLEWNVKKYLHRWRRKGKPVEDLRKASWYLNRLINELED